MSFEKNSYVNGSDLLLLVDGKAVGHCTTHQLTLNTETKDRAVKPAKTEVIGRGLWKEKGITSKSVSVSAEGLHYYAEAEEGYKSLLALYDAAEPVQLKGLERGNDSKPYFTGMFVITSLTCDAPAADDVKYTVQFENSGPVSFDVEGLTDDIPLQQIQ